MFLLTSSTYLMQNQSVVLSYLEGDKLKKQYSLLVSSLILSIILSLVPISLILTLQNNLTQPMFLVKDISHFLIIWVLSSILAAVIGSSVSILMKNNFSYLVSFLIYGWFVWKSRDLPVNPINRYLNIFDDNTYIMSNTISGPLFNMNYLLDKLFVILVIAFFISIVRISVGVSLKKKFTNLSMSLFFLGFIIYLPYLNTISNASTSVENKQSSNFTYQITKYEMDLDLVNSLKNTAILTINFMEPTENIFLNLDDTFSIKSIEINNESTTFTHENNLVRIPSNYKRGDTILVTVQYEGTVELVNNLGFTTYYVSGNAVNLPGTFFDWYPTMENKNAVDFDITVNSNADIYSNIDWTSTKKNKLIGTTTSLDLFAGQYQQLQKDGVQYIIPISYNANEFVSDLQTSLKGLIESGNLSKDDLLNLKNKRYRQVIVTIWPLNASDSYIQINGDTILINYNQ
ncbi:hypothetical protein [Sporosarcina sp. SAFN-010]|uniref:hypothetical protein n=1 Tax=Sporosarcina sp. SAFN-010 TaxID=3387273 RepID=UPI003F7E3412